MRFDIRNTIETFLVGFFGTIILSACVGALVGTYFILREPFILLCVLGGAAFIFSVGWCIEHYDDFKREFFSTDPPKKQELQYRQYDIPVIDALSKFETKHHLSTIEFMAFVYRNQIPAGVDNLDYLEWISLVNALPSITNETEEDK